MAQRHPAGISLDTVYAVAYGYESYGRSASIRSDVNSVSSGVQYAYAPGADLVASMANTAGFSWARIYEQNRDLIASVENAFAANQISAYGYGNDAYTAIAGGLAYSPTFDLDGNMTWAGKSANSWDGENRLIRSEPGGIATKGAVRTLNRYDHMNRRVESSVEMLSGRGAGYPMDPSQPGTWDAVETRSFLYDGWLPVIEKILREGAGTEIREHVWGRDLGGTRGSAGGVGGLLATRIGHAWYFPLYDMNGNITDYINEFGANVAHREYDAFGHTIAKSGPMADTFNFWFSTKYLDHETDLYYYGYRFYSPEIQRFINRDPVGENGGRNLYGFCGNNPVNRYDKLGLFIIRPVAGSPRVKTNPDGSFGGMWASVVILPDDDGTPLSGVVLHMKHTEIHVTDCDGKPISDSVQTVQKRIPTHNRASWPLESGQIAPIYSNVAVIGGYGKCVKGRILVKAVWYHFVNTAGLPPLGKPTLDSLSGSLDNDPYPHGRIGSTSGWPSVSSGSYRDFGSLSIEIILNCSSPLYDIHATGRGLDSAHSEIRKDRWSDQEGSEAYVW